MVKGIQMQAIMVDNNSEKTVGLHTVTGLPTLRQVFRWFEDFSLSCSKNGCLSVTVYEISKYVYILENFGIECVDEMLSVFTRMLQQCWGNGAYIGHISDERLVVMAQFADDNNREDIAAFLEEQNQRLIKEIEKYNITANKSYFLEADYGYVLLEPGWEGGFEQYLRLGNSEMLLKRLQKDVTSAGNSRAVLWKHQEVFQLLVEKNMFHYHFQPIVDTQNGTIFGYEALMRTDPVINMRPLEVIDIATKLGKLYEIEKATMSNVMEYLEQHIDAFEERKMFINSIPAHMLKLSDWEQLVDRYGSLMSKLVVEMTEQTEMDDEQLTKFRNRLKKFNISLAIDDYGTGFSNLSNLIRYSPNYVKIDRALIKNIEDKPKIQKLVTGIIEFIHENGYSALAEGVETYEELKTMIGLGSDFIQGYYLAKPDSVLLDEIEEKFREEIIALNLMRSEYIVKVYTPSENETVNLSQLATQHYNSIFIDKENVTIEGVVGTSISCSITVKENIQSNITLKNVNIITEKEVPLIDIGAGSNVTMQIEGINEIHNRGIRVPQGSELWVTRSGSLYIHCEMQNSFAIGGDKESSYGNIHIEQLSQLVIDINGENCVGIGGGKNTADSNIYIVHSGIHLECAGGNAIGVGSFNGNSRMDIKNSSLEIKMSCANAVGIGAMRGRTSVIMHNYSLNITESGNNLCGIGVLSNGEGSVLASDGTIECDIRGKSMVCVGSDYGALDCIVENTNTIFYCEGNSVVGIGDMNGRGNVSIHDANLIMTILAKDILDIGSKNGRLELMNSKRNIKINE